MKTKEKIIKRLNEAFDLGIPLNAPCFHHLGALGDWSWCVACGRHDIGSSASMTEALSWTRWLYDTELNEIFECPDYLIDAYKNDKNVWIEQK